MAIFRFGQGLFPHGCAVFSLQLPAEFPYQPMIKRLLRLARSQRWSFRTKNQGTIPAGRPNRQSQEVERYKKSNSEDCRKPKKQAMNRLASVTSTTAETLSLVRAASMWAISLAFISSGVGPNESILTSCRTKFSRQRQPCFVGPARLNKPGPQDAGDNLCFSGFYSPAIFLDFVNIQSIYQASKQGQTILLAVFERLLAWVGVMKAAPGFFPAQGHC
jgi:hypothetical protein